MLDSELPDELIASRLAPTDLRALQQVSMRLHALVTASAALQYALELHSPIGSCGAEWQGINQTDPSNDLGVLQARLMFVVPRFVKRPYAWYLAISNTTSSTPDWPKTEYLDLIAKREGYPNQWFKKLKEKAFDFILVTVPTNMLPAATPRGSMKDGFKGALDYSAGVPVMPVMPVMHVHKELDGLNSKEFKPRNVIERDMYKMYDATRMHGLPVGVQVAGKRLEEEKVLEGMKLINGILREAGKAYPLLEPSGYKMKAKPGSMVAMDATVHIKGKLKFSVKKTFTGGEMSESIFTGTRRGNACSIALPAAPSASVSGKGLFVYHVDGAGVMWVQSLGAITSRTLQPGEQWIGD
ncbi:hypothetical protein C8Q74DRAFT_1219704 [Fomes fomentarius]|nr:hypothetical protein C8Q74DRAFT_1219704 [Fomes fomentarius]